MIFPYIAGILSWRLAPVTWLLFALQFCVYVFSLSPHLEGQGRLERVVTDPVFAEYQGRLYARYILERKSIYPASLSQLSMDMIRKNDRGKAQILGGMAFRDLAFSREAIEQPALGDPVIFSWWKEKFQEIVNFKQSHPSYMFGITSSGLEDIRKWISYQFSHSGLMHFFSNMIFMLIFGCALEVVIGGLGVMVVFLGSGLLAAAVFLVLEGPSAAPLVGASGAVSGMMALFTMIYWKRGVRFFYFLFIPKPGYHGFVFLPAWVILGLWVLGDLAGYIATPPALGGVAHAAHLGGEMAGVVIGLSLYFLRRFGSDAPWPLKSAFIDEGPSGPILHRG